MARVRAKKIIEPGAHDVRAQRGGPGLRNAERVLLHHGRTPQPKLGATWEQNQGVFPLMRFRKSQKSKAGHNLEMGRITLSRRRSRVRVPSAPPRNSLNENNLFILPTLFHFKLGSNWQQNPGDFHRQQVLAFEGLLFLIVLRLVQRHRPAAILRASANRDWFVGIRIFRWRALPSQETHQSGEPIFQLSYHHPILDR